MEDKLLANRIYHTAQVKLISAATVHDSNCLIHDPMPYLAYIINQFDEVLE